MPTEEWTAGVEPPRLGFRSAMHLCARCALRSCVRTAPLLLRAARGCVLVLCDSGYHAASAGDAPEPTRFEASAGGLLVTHVDQASPAAASGIAAGDLIIAAAPPESKMLLVSSAETSFFVALLREANPIFVRLKRGEHESTICIQKVGCLPPV